MEINRFIPKQKLSKKVQQKLNSQKRQMWDFNPATRTVKNRKAYSRKKHLDYDEHGGT